VNIQSFLKPFLDGVKLNNYCLNYEQTVVDFQRGYWASPRDHTKTVIVKTTVKSKMGEGNG
jgi:hypothetical protein